MNLAEALEQLNETPAAKKAAAHDLHSIVGSSRGNLGKIKAAVDQVWPTLKPKEILAIHAFLANVADELVLGEE